MGGSPFPSSGDCIAHGMACHGMATLLKQQQQQQQQQQLVDNFILAFPPIPTYLQV